MKLRSLILLTIDTTHACPVPSLPLALALLEFYQGPATLLAGEKLPFLSDLAPSFPSWGQIATNIARCVRLSSRETRHRFANVTLRFVDFKVAERPVVQLPST